MKRFAVAALALLATTVVAQPDMDKYNKSCAVCHASGAANAPKTHDVDAWKTRLDKGMDPLLQSVTNGVNAMPPKGMCFDCTAEDYKALIEFMASPAK